MKKFTSRTVILPTLMFSVLVSGATFGQNTKQIEASAIRSYDQLLREYNETRAKIKNDLSRTERGQIIDKLQALRFRAQEIHYKLEITAESKNRELLNRYASLQASMTGDIQPLMEAGRTSPATEDGSRLYAEIEKLAAIAKLDDPVAASKALDQIIERVVAAESTDPKVLKLLSALEVERNPPSLNTAKPFATLNEAASTNSTAERANNLNEARIVSQFHGTWRDKSREIDFGIDFEGGDVIWGRVADGEWVQSTLRPGKVEAGVISTTWEAACDGKDDTLSIPARLRLSADGKSLVFETVVVRCDDKGNMTVKTNEWEKLFVFDTFVKTSDDVPPRKK